MSPRSSRLPSLPEAIQSRARLSSFSHCRAQSGSTLAVGLDPVGSGSGQAIVELCYTYTRKEGQGVGESEEA